MKKVFHDIKGIVEIIHSKGGHVTVLTIPPFRINRPEHKDLPWINWNIKALRSSGEIVFSIFYFCVFISIYFLDIIYFAVVRYLACILIFNNNCFSPECTVLDINEAFKQNGKPIEDLYERCVNKLISSKK